MKIVSIHGSPRPDGNSTALANRILDAAEKRGAETHRYHLNSLNYQGCQACYARKKGSETCVLTDDLAVVLDDVYSADVLIMASPVYCTDVSAQLKVSLTVSSHFWSRGISRKPERVVSPKTRCWSLSLPRVTVIPGCLPISSPDIFRS